MFEDTNYVIDLDQLAREELETLAQSLRRRALQGDQKARGPAHACEVAYRQRFGPTSPPATLRDLRPIAVLPVAKRWRF
jgi:hypothetical protein